MNQGTYPLAASMINQVNRLDQISNNLANVNTNGFKQEGTAETTFNYYLQRAQEQNVMPTKISTVTNNIPKIDSKFINSEMGPIAMTGNNLDFALNSPDTFFKVQNAAGDIVYTRELTEQGFYPPINLLKSASRVMDKVVNKEHYNDFLKLKRVLSLIKENEVLVRVGAYKPGMDPELDNAMSKKEQIREFLTQDTQKVFGFNEIVTMFRKVLQ